MKRFFMFILPLLAVALLFGKGPIELVESIPVETTLDNEDIRNTPEVWLEMINGAKRTLDFGEFYISHKDGEALTPVLEAVTAAADRGVQVRFVIDGSMYKTYPETADKLNEYPNIEVRVYDLNGITGGVLHAKYFIVDEREIFLGSQNFDWRALKHIHELGLRIEDKSLVKFYKQLFDLDWALSAEDADTDAILGCIRSDENLYRVSITDKGYGKSTLLPTASNPHIIYYPANGDEIQLLNLIDHAEESIRIQLLSYSPLSRDGLYEQLDFALRRAAARGVNIEMILSDWNFHSPRIEYIKSLHAVPNITVKFSTIPEASEGYIGYARVEHCKFMVIDNSVFWLGTSNWSKSYFHHGRNLGIVVKNNKMAKRVSDIFLKSWDSGYCSPVELGKNYEAKRTAE
ncbi:MAG: phospholipase D-like domain-containing protein [Candidatus Neomarinimicrobiota bacterium]